jgi:hypothetical protein
MLCQHISMTYINMRVNCVVIIKAFRTRQNTKTQKRNNKLTKPLDQVRDSNVAIVDELYQQDV